ncbi:MAG: hypothetical protein ACOC8N_03925 [Spirochaetota bacterium]
MRQAGGLHLRGLIIMIAFLSEYIDATLGMGYGAVFTPMLLLFGSRSWG